MIWLQVALVLLREVLRTLLVPLRLLGWQTRLQKA
jgi:hypothetical protein